MMTPAQRTRCDELWPLVQPLARGDQDAEGAAVDALVAAILDDATRSAGWYRQRVRWALASYRRTLAREKRRGLVSGFGGDFDKLPSSVRGLPVTLEQQAAALGITPRQLRNRRANNDQKRSQ